MSRKKRKTVKRKKDIVIDAEEKPKEKAQVPSAAHSHLFSPSQYMYDKICPARVILSQQIAKPEAGEAAARGTAMHDVGDKILRTMFKTSLTETKKKSAIKKELAELNSDDERELVLAYAHAVKAIREKVMSQIAGQYIEYFEAKLSDGDDSFGTVDYGLSVIGKKAHIVCQDLKTGEIDVEIEENPQLSRYALMQIAQLPEGTEVAGAHLVIHQPKTDSDPKIWKASPEYLAEFKKEFEAHKKNVYRMLKEGVEEDEYNVTEHCKYCPALGICPAQLKQREMEVESLMENVPAPTSVDVRTLSLEKRTAIYNNSKMIEKFLDAVKKSLIDDALDGAEIPGLKLVGTHSKRGWDKDQKVQDIAKSLRELGAKSVTKTSLIAIGAVEKQIGKDKSLLAPFTTMSKSNPCLVPLSDSREPWKVGVEKELLD